MIPVKRPFPLPACPDFSVPFSLLPTILEPFLASLIPLAIPTPEFFLEHTSEWPYRTSPTLLQPGGVIMTPKMTLTLYVEISSSTVPASRSVTPLLCQVT